MVCRQLEPAETGLDSSLDRLVVTAEAQDGCSIGHSERVMRHSCAIGAVLGLDSTDMEALRLGALLHDVGKVGVPSQILAKRGNLNVADRTWVKKHPRIGFELLRYRRDLRKCLPIVLCHHERLDGSGYPNGLRQDEVPLPARIVAVADIFDAMASARPYRKALSKHVVVDYLIREADLGRLDREIVDILADSIREGNAGTRVSTVAA